MLKSFIIIFIFVFTLYSNELSDKEMIDKEIETSHLKYIECLEEFNKQKLENNLILSVDARVRERKLKRIKILLFKYKEELYKEKQKNNLLKLSIKSLKITEIPDDKYKKEVKTKDNNLKLFSENTIQKITKVVEGEAYTYSLKLDSNLYNKPNGKMIEVWKSKTIFTSNISTKKWIKVTGNFVNGKWSKVINNIWIEKINIKR